MSAAVEAAGGAGDSAAPQKFSLDVLEVIKTAQTQNGLRHNDFDRYAQYCTRRLHRIRHAKAVDFTFGKGKKFVGKTLTADMVTDVRHLHIPLMDAERAWAMSQKFKQDISDGSGGAAERYHPVQRLRKAVKWANLLESLASEKGDARTSLEAQAYAAWMRALLAVDTEDWLVAADNVTTAKKIYEQLAAATVRRQKELYTARLEEIAPIERFCKYNLSRKAGKAAVTKIAEGLDDKIAAALAQAKDADNASGNTILWKNTHVVVRNAKLQASLSAANERAALLAAETEVAASAAPGSKGEAGSLDLLSRSGESRKSASSKTELGFLDLLSRLDESLKLATSEAARATKEGRAELAGDFKAVEEYTRFLKLRHTLDRNATVIADAVWSLQSIAAGAAQAETAEVGKGKPKKAKAAAAPGGTKQQAASSSTPSPFTQNPWLASLAGVSTQQSLATGVSVSAGVGANVEGINVPAMNAANTIATWHARSLRTLDDMILLAGGTPPADNPVTRDAIAAAGMTKDKAGGDDADLVAALVARRAVVLAWRAYYIAVASVYNKKYGDATVLMHRAQDRAHFAMDLFETLPVALRPKQLPARPLTPGNDASAAHPTITVSGLSLLDVDSIKTLLDKISQQTVALQATALLEQLAPKVRPDGSFAEAYVNTFMAKGTKPAMPTSLKRSDRGITLQERVTVGAVEPTVDAATVDAWPPAPQAVPFKPLLLDLASNFFAYPDMKARAPDVFRAAAKSTANSTAAPAPASGGSGLLGWFGR